MSKPKQERKGLPSASKFKQYSDCPGSYSLGKSAPQQSSSGRAQRGTNIHAGCAGEVDLKTLKLDEQQAVSQLLQQEEMLLDSFTNSRHGGGWSVNGFKVETRMWAQASKVEWSGKPDKVYTLKSKEGEKAGLIIDYKSSRYAESAEQNLQLAALAVLLDEEHHHGLDMIFVALVYPDGYDQAVYDVPALQEAAIQCKSLVDAVTITHTETRSPSTDACRWCNAKSICPDVHAEMGALIKRGKQELGPKDYPDLLKRCGLASALIDEIRSKAKDCLKRGGKIEGWTLRPGATRKTISDTEEVYRRAATLGIDGIAFSKKVGITNADLEGLIRDELKIGGKNLMETVAELTDGCTTSKTTEPSLREVKA